MLINSKFYTSSSPIQGMGLYSYVDIVKGQVIWTKGPIDIFIDMKDIPIELRDYWDRYATVQKYGEAMMYYLDGDECKYMNHSETPNIIFKGSIGLALEDIPANTELTCDYRTITTPEHYEFLMTQ
jgi:hypothetical protein